MNLCRCDFGEDSLSRSSRRPGKACQAVQEAKRGGEARPQELRGQRRRQRQEVRPANSRAARRSKKRRPESLDRPYEPRVDAARGGVRRSQRGRAFSVPKRRPRGPFSVAVQHGKGERGATQEGPTRRRRRPARSGGRRQRRAEPRVGVETQSKPPGHTGGDRRGVFNFRRAHGGRSAGHQRALGPRRLDKLDGKDGRFSRLRFLLRFFFVKVSSALMVRFRVSGSPLLRGNVPTLDATPALRRAG